MRLFGFLIVVIIALMIVILTTIIFTRFKDYYGRLKITNEIECDNVDYRLGDVLKYRTTEQWGIDIKKIDNCFPDSLAQKYIRATNINNDYETLKNLVLNMDIKTSPSIAIHLRLGDMLDDFSIGPREIAELINKLLDGTDERPIVYYGSHNGWLISESNEFLNEFLTYFDADIAEENHPDIHFAEMVGADIFIQGKGGFSVLIADVRKKLGKTTIWDEKLASLYIS